MIDENPMPGDFYKFSSISVEHFPELQGHIDGLKEKRQLSDHETYLNYISELGFTIPEPFPEAKSLIVMAVSDPVMNINFHYKGVKKEVTLAPGYISSGYTVDTITELVKTEIIKDIHAKVQMTGNVHQKLSAVRSGLAKYGRNNITYVEGMGSYHRLYSFLTDAEMPDNLTEMSMLDQCEGCRICMNSCPHGCITEKNFVINAGRCLTLYNELKGEFPNWIPPGSHNALMGCLLCQRPCPANKGKTSGIGRLPDITEGETKRILEGTPDEALLETLGDKMRMFHPATSEDYFEVFTRNLSVLIQK